MVFEKLGINIDSNDYYKENKYDENSKKVSLHLRISPEIANEFVKTIAVYRNYGVDKRELTKSELGAIIIKEFTENLPDDDSTILDLIAKVKTFRDGGVVSE
jgi:hypothetical protein